MLTYISRLIQVLRWNLSPRRLSSRSTRSQTPPTANSLSRLGRCRVRRRRPPRHLPPTLPTIAAHAHVYVYVHVHALALAFAFALAEPSRHMCSRSRGPMRLGPNADRHRCARIRTSMSTSKRPCRRTCKPLSPHAFSLSRTPCDLTSTSIAIAIAVAAHAHALALAPTLADPLRRTRGSPATWPRRRSPSPSPRTHHAHTRTRTLAEPSRRTRARTRGPCDSAQRRSPSPHTHTHTHTRTRTCSRMRTCSRTPPSPHTHHPGTLSVDDAAALIRRLQEPCDIIGRR